ncbi:hypothetical protein F5X99DRAFT_307159 [Biscogniauxia marginata]|nr:hypothetical protein F5X99DRAFT_307159 [Biscogniauxia marginata]
MSELKEKRTRKTDRTYASSPITHMKRAPIKAHKRPLRTYSKRTIPSDIVEPPAKRQRVDDVHHDSQAQKSPAGSDVDVSIAQYTLPDPPTTAPARKGTITAYFKKIDPPTSSSILPSEASSDNVEPAATPPSSPPMLSTQRKKARRLTTRAMARDSEESGDEVGKKKESKTEHPATVTDKESSHLEGEGILATVSSRTLNQMDNLPKKRSEAGKRGKVATVQTTLSLSMTDTGFAECKDCNMLYNPFHEKDAKDHARIHAALRKAKSDTKNNTTG